MKPPHRKLGSNKGHLFSPQCIAATRQLEAKRKTPSPPMPRNPKSQAIIDRQAAAKKNALIHRARTALSGKDAFSDRTASLVGAVGKITHPDAPKSLTRAEFDKLSPAAKSSYCIKGELPSEAEALTRAEFRELTPNQKARHCKAGGKIT